MKGPLAARDVYAYGIKNLQECRLVVAVVAKNALSISPSMTAYSNMLHVAKSASESLIKEILNV